MPKLSTGGSERLGQPPFSTTNTAHICKTTAVTEPPGPSTNEKGHGSLHNARAFPAQNRDYPGRAVAKPTSIEQKALNGIKPCSQPYPLADLAPACMPRHVRV